MVGEHCVVSVIILNTKNIKKYIYLRASSRILLVRFFLAIALLTIVRSAFCSPLTKGILTKQFFFAA